MSEVYNRLQKEESIMRRVTIKNPEEAKAVLMAEIHRTNETRLQHRLHCILLICDGKSCAEVVALFGDSLRAVQYWVKRYNEAGIEGDSYCQSCALRLPWPGYP